MYSVARLRNTQKTFFFIVSAAQQMPAQQNTQQNQSTPSIQQIGPVPFTSPCRLLRQAVSLSTMTWQKYQSFDRWLQKLLIAGPITSISHQFNIYFACQRLVFNTGETLLLTPANELPLFCQVYRVQAIFRKSQANIRALERTSAHASNICNVIYLHASTTYKWNNCDVLRCVPFGWLFEICMKYVSARAHFQRHIVCCMKSKTLTGTHTKKSSVSIFLEISNRTNERNNHRTPRIVDLCSRQKIASQNEKKLPVKLNKSTQIGRDCFNDRDFAVQIVCNSSNRARDVCFLHRLNAFSFVAMPLFCSFQI